MKSSEVKSLWGQEFKVVEQGLAEEQVVAFVTNLVKQRDSLLERQQHLNSLQKLAEKTVTEANELAKSIKQEAQSEAAKLIEEAEDIAREVTYEVQRQAEAKVQGEVDRVLKDARQKAAALIEATKKQASNEIKGIRDKFVWRLENLIAELGATKKAVEQAMAGGVKKSELEALTLSVPISEASNSDEKESIEVKADLEHEPATMVTTMRKTEEKTTAAGFTNKLATLPLPSEHSALFKGEAEIAVVPPVDTVQFARLSKKLEDVPHLRVLNTDGYWDEGYIITALIDNPLPLITVLRGMAEVEKAQLWTDGRKGSDGHFPGWMAFKPRPGGLKGNRAVVRLRKELR